MPSNRGRASRGADLRIGPGHLLERYPAVEPALAPGRFVSGNKVTLLLDGDATYAAMLSAIGTARDHVHMESYIVEDDNVGRRFADALMSKAREGLSVSLIYDAVGALGTSAEYFERLRDAGVALLEFNPLNPLEAKAGWSPDSRDHRKLLVVDGTIAFLGGVNISGVYSSRGSVKSTARRGARLPWRDTHVQIEGPVVAACQRMYLETWRRQQGTPLRPCKCFPELESAGDETVCAIAGSPDAGPSAIYATLLSTIDRAERSVLLTNAYFVPDTPLRDALKMAAARGVDVRLILPSRTDSSLVLDAGHSYYDELLRSGVRIFERRHALLHAKTAVIDGAWSTIGSTNLDWRSFQHNYEVNAVILGSGFARELQTVFEHDLAESDEITLHAWQERPTVARLREAFARLWARWL